MSRRVHLLLLLFVPFVLAPGCAGENPTTVSQSVQEGGRGADHAPQPPEAKAPAGAGQPIERKIIYSATIEVVVKDLDVARAAVEKVVEEQKGYIAKSEVIGESGSRRTATWTLKVPAERFQASVSALAALGNTVRNSSDSQDVTEEFIDLQARIKNLKVEEETLNKILKDQVVKIEDVLKVREQIVKVRGDIERAEGRLKYLATMAAMSTITLTVREDASYVPPTAPTFGSRVTDTFDSSLRALRNFGEWAALVAVALAPWLPLILIGALAFRWLIKKASAAAAAAPERRPRQARPMPTEVARPLPPPEAAPSPPGEGDRPRD
jgi:hypothetical protein